MLGWGNPLASAGEPEAWQQKARVLAGQAKLHVVLPRYSRAVNLENVTITDLETAELPGRDQGGSQQASYPFAPAPAFQPPTIPLYGTPVYTGKQAPRAGQHPAAEAASAGCPSQVAGVGKRDQPTAQTAPALLHSRIIDYARKVSRFAQGQHFDGIYAFDWQTYLAAMELRLITGKKMVLHVHALSQTRPYADRLGWMQELERQAMERAEAILLDDDRLAAEIIKEYDFTAGKLSIGRWGDRELEAVHQVFRDKNTGLNFRKEVPGQQPMPLSVPVATLC